MPLIRPFKALRPLPQKAQELAAPPYDVLNSDEARTMASGKPLSFLHISKPEIDLDPQIDHYSPEVYQKGAQNLQALINQGILRQDKEAGYYFYEMEAEGHKQRGLVAVASAEDYDRDLIVKHELTREDKEQDRIRMIDQMNCQASPVLLAFNADQEYRAIATASTNNPPEFEVLGPDGVIHRLWCVFDPELIERLNLIFTGPNAKVTKLYIADGHHRSASGAKIAAKRKAANPAHTGEEPYNYFLAVIFPADQMRILDYNRVVKDLNGLRPDAFLAEIRGAFNLEEKSEAHRPTRPGEFGMYLERKWYKVTIKPQMIPTDPVQALDVSLLYDHLLAPILGIGNPRTDQRIDFVGGARGLGELKRRVDSGEMAVAFSLYPTQMSQIMAVAEAGQIMPPKSTWFEPKLLDGLICHLL
ncbi:MAG: hypothetical protein A2527_09365 [Candidatus Lambdaproteobacteria bacterium RIFOXYD2_FULL_50_16]|uniref:DUF1015 domain-containing protein n=1 Tax=Candidatus Lambdaproteobacteria bacterium RIFOXYD2_FULL_50_16 TaxID=1817772 RepID=A0A1F6G7H4_9PROT|nr:MAG: hypothetical protein A2527_09365 [Candidatus Lambdaproteobacteria bacterium RIFOXYD2_FULL_50_16]